MPFLLYILLSYETMIRYLMLTAFVSVAKILLIKNQFLYLFNHSLLKMVIKLIGFSFKVINEKK